MPLPPTAGKVAAVCEDARANSENVLHPAMGHAPAFIELAFADTQAVDPGLQPALLAILDSQERERHARLLREQDRRTYLATHVMRRLLLSVQLGMVPQEIEFIRESGGRPALSPALLQGAQPGACAPRFSTSHSGALGVVAISHAQLLGVDIERHDASAIALVDSPLVLDPLERQDLRGRDPAQRLARFFSYWSLKEACLKAIGQGLHVDPASIAFDHLDGTPTLRLNAPPAHTMPREFAVFETVHREQRYAIALAWSGPDSPNTEPNSADSRPIQALMFGSRAWSAAARGRFCCSDVDSMHLE